MKNKKHIVMLGTSFGTMGGISSVVNVYRESGLFDRFPIIYLATHCDGTVLTKLRFCISSWLHYLVLLLRGKVALIHVHTASNASFWRKTLFFFPAFLLQVPSILHLHGGGAHEFYEMKCNRIAKWVIRYVFDHVDCIVVLSGATQRWLQSISRNPRILVIYNAVRSQAVTDFSLRESLNILFLGRLGDGKGSYDLLAAVSRIVGHHANLKLMLGGDGELDRTREMAGKLGIGENVEILGWVSGPDKSALLARAAIYVLPSYAEGLPMSVLEAMATGLPVVCTPVGGMPEAITDGLEGYLVLPGDVAALSSALDRLLSDEGLRRRMGEAARNKVESTFSTEQILPQIERLYHELGVQT